MDEAALLAAILADPSDDAPRLVFAAWLEEHGQEGRGEFIRLEIELARIGHHAYENPRWPDIIGRLIEFVGGGNVRGKGPLHEWAKEILPGKWESRPGYEIHDLHHEPTGIAVKFRRGFVESLSCDAASWLDHADAITAAQPVRSVTLTTWPDRSRRLSISTTGPDVVTVLVPLAGRLVESSAATEGEAVSEAMRQRWPGITFHLPTIDRWGSFDVPVYDPAAQVVPTL